MSPLAGIRIYTVPAGTPIKRDGVTLIVENGNIVFDGGEAYVTPKVCEQIQSLTEDRP